MSIGLYMDVHVPGAATQGLRVRNVDVLTAQEDNTTETSDPELLDRATELGRLMVTQDEDFLAEATLRQREAMAFSGVVFARQTKVSIGQLIENLELIALAGEPREFASRVTYLPLG